MKFLQCNLSDFTASAGRSHCIT